MFDDIEKLLIFFIGKRKYDCLTTKLLREIGKCYENIELDDAVKIAFMNKIAILLIGIYKGKHIDNKPLYETHLKKLKEIDKYLIAKDINDFTNKHKNNIETIIKVIKGEKG